MRWALFEGFGTVSRKDARDMAELGVEGVILGLNDEDDDRRGIESADKQDRFRLRWGLDRYMRSVDNLAEAGLWTALMGWLRPRKDWCDQTLEVCDKLLWHEKVVGWVSDGERYLHADMLLEDGHTHERAAREIVAPFWAEMRLWDMWVGFTDYSGLPRDARPYAGELVEGDWAIPQVLCRSDWAKKKGGSIYRPERLPRHAARTWGPHLRQGVLLVCETALFAQSGWRGEYGSVYGAMSRTTQVCRSVGASVMCPWSWRASGKTTRSALRKMIREGV